MNSLISVRGLRVRRGQSFLLEVDSLDVARGEVLSVVGPNGAGKTTLLLALARLLAPLEGEIRFLGRSSRDRDDLDARRKIALVFQDPILLDMNVEENVSLGLRFRGLSRAETRERAFPWLERLGIEHLAQRRANRLSAGESQRVSLARAFVLDPELLLLDEPFLTLDPSSRAGLLEDLKRVLKDGRRTAVFVTHNLNEAATLSERAAIILGGRLREVGQTRELRSRPADPDVAAFLRSMPR